jgi:hypothetical protein
MTRAIMSLFALLLLLSATASAQITISSNDFMPVPGTQLDYLNDAFVSESDFNSLLSGSGGPMNWDFSFRVYSGGYTNYSVDPASVPAIDSFPDANLALFSYIVGTTDSVWQVYNSSPTSYTQLGSVSRVSSVESVVTFEDIAPDWIFPITYNDQLTSYRHNTQYSSSTYSKTYDTTYNTVDAWGTATYGANSVPCLRVINERRVTTEVYDLQDMLISSFTQEFTNVGFVAAGFEYLVGVNRVSFMGIETYTGAIAGDFYEQTTDVRQEETTSLPTQFGLSQNYPNPFNPNTQIRLSVPARGHVELTVYDVLGRRVRTLIDRELSAGTYTADWNGRNEAGEPVASGVYVYRLQTDQYVTSRKMVLLR